MLTRVFWACHALTCWFTGQNLSVNRCLKRFFCVAHFRISKSLDFFNVMTYDLHGSWDNFADHHAPLKERSYDYWPFNTLNAVSFVQYFYRNEWQSFWSILQPKVDWIKGYFKCFKFPCFKSGASNWFEHNYI